MVSIKGKTLQVLVVEIDKENFEEIKKELDEQLSKSFFSKTAGFPFVIFPKGNVSSKTVEKVIEYLQSKGLKPLLASTESNATPKVNIQQQEESSRVKVITKNLRSGQLVEFNGDILIIGDVNPGAEVRASGNIIVMGALRGTAWAGYLGDTNSVIVALKMQPQQLRIANIFAAPDEEEKNKGADYPEVAKVENNEIVIEPLV
jgi:septum site-determining protein MinC